MLAAAEGSLVVRPAAVEQPVGRLVVGRHLVVRQLAVLVLAPPLEQLIIAQLLEREPLFQASPVLSSDGSG